MSGWLSAAALLLVSLGLGRYSMTLQREIAKAVASPDLKERFVALGFAPVGSTPEEFAAFIRSEMETWGKVIRAGNLKPDG